MILKNSLVPVIVAITVSAQAAPVNDSDKLVALARLYGVVRWFHPADASQEIDWNLFAIHAANRVCLAQSAKALEAALMDLFSPVSVGISVGAEPPPAGSFSEAPDARWVAWHHLGMGSGSSSRSLTYQSGRTHRSPLIALLFNRVPFAKSLQSGAHVDVELGLGLRARVPLVLTDAGARITPGQQPMLAALNAKLNQKRDLEATDRDVRAADVIVAWSVFRHFYPYWADLTIDWDEHLPGLLEAAAAANSRAAHRLVLRRLVAKVGDGHGSVSDLRDDQKRSVLPIAVRWVERQLAVTASSVRDQVQPGDVITAVDGAPVKAWFVEPEALQSGSPQWRAVWGLRALTHGPAGSRVALTVERQSAILHRELKRTEEVLVRESRPEPITQVRHAVWYIDLERTQWKDLQLRLPELAAAKAIVFDIRGYPTDAARWILPHLLSAPERDRWMHIPFIIEPFGRIATWQSFGWNLTPAYPHLPGRVAFLTDARAISYAESVLGYVTALNLGTIVGSSTAGANGDVNTFSVPSGMTIRFTGMRVTGHDGSPFHEIGVRPHVFVEPTLASIRAGRDEVLDRALEVVRPSEDDQFRGKQLDDLCARGSKDKDTSRHADWHSLNFRNSSACKMASAR